MASHNEVHTRRRRRTSLLGLSGAKLPIRNHATNARPKEYTTAGGRALAKVTPSRKPRKKSEARKKKDAAKLAKKWEQRNSQQQPHSHRIATSSTPTRRRRPASPQGYFRVASGMTLARGRSIHARQVHAQVRRD